MVTETTEIKDIRKYRGKWQSRKEYESVVEVRDRFKEMQLGRSTSCPYPSEEISGTIEPTGSDWAARWNQDLKLWSMWGEILEGRTNLKSPTSFAPVEAALAEFQDNQIKATLTATHEKDCNKSIVYERILDHLYYSAGLQKVNNETFKNTLIFGTGISYITWIRKAREVEVIKSADEAERMVKSGKKKEVKARLEEGKPITSKEEIVEYDDIAVVPISIYEFFVDPDARCMRGTAYEATDCVWRTTPSIEQFKAEFRSSNDPWVKKENIEKVVPAYMAESLYNGDMPFFKTPEDITGKTKIELIKYYNKQTDKYIVIANDVLVREGPLPYNHKQLPFVVHKLIEFPDMFYGVGLPTLLEHNQSEDETLRNLNLDQMKISINPPILMNSMVFPDIDQQWERTEPGQKINVDGDVGPGSVRVLEIPGSKFDYFQMRNTFSEDAIKISGINPIMSSYPRSNTAVRTNMLVQESGLKHVRKYVKNWADGYVDAIRQIIMLIKQFYPDAYTEKYDPYLQKKTREYKTILTKNEQLYEGEGGAIEVEKKKGVHYFEVKGEYLDLTGELEVEIDIDSLLPTSRTAKMQKIEAALAQLTPIVSNPMLRNAPGMPTLIQEYIKTHALPTGVSDDFQDENTIRDEESAIEQNELMKQGQMVPGIPGESNVHKMQHTTLLVGLQSELTTAMMSGTASPEIVQMAQQLMQNIMQHLATDDMERTGGSMPQVGGGVPNPSGPQIPTGPTAPATMEPSGGGEMPQMGPLPQ